MKIFVSLFAFFCIIPAIVFSATNDFPRTLYVGMRGEDVRELQKFLNTDTQTRVADTGLGSPGSETDFFGPATKRAVIKFQEKYRTEVLAPIGLISGTGFFGEKTRVKANTLASISRSVSPILTLLDEVVASSTEKGKVIVMFPSQYSGKPGTMITLSGAGFTSTDNTIYFGNDHAVVKAVSWNGQNITFKIPNIPKGIYSLFVKNTRGDSNKGAFFVITDGVTPEPKIESLAPEHVLRGGAIEIKGSGFLSSGNVIQYGVGVIKNISSTDGSSLSFTIPIDAITTSTSSSVKKMALPVWAYVINENGVSNAKSFTLGL